MTNRVEQLLERLVEQNEQIIVALHAIEAGLDNVGTLLEGVTEHDENAKKLESMEGDLDWTKPSSTAALLVEKLSAIASSLFELQLHGSSSGIFAEAVVDRLRAIEATLGKIEDGLTDR